ncbi:pentapeptide repeat-containing protein [Sphaerisporangium aureirubrum]|uniref:Pentapeptide repeat-containing protein n=1 Tax=Sphaerisporangium aureirubrum TaxID=1544736 RepID=A0ABW1N905_9ACTN
MLARLMADRLVWLLAGPFRRRAREPGLRSLGGAIAAVLFLATVLVLGVTFAGLLLIGWPGIEQRPRIPISRLFDIVKLAFAFVAGIGGVVALVLAYRRQRVVEEDNRRQEAENSRKERSILLEHVRDERDRTRLFNERFATVATQLGSEAPAVRLAGVYAMAELADDWQQHRQVCIDVLCAFFRMPHTPRPAADAPAAEVLDWRRDREVRRTVIEVIAAHLRPGSPVSWRGHDFDFSGATFDGGDFSGSLFSDGSAVSFKGAVFAEGVVRFDGAVFGSSEVSFDRAEFHGGSVSFYMAKVTGAVLNFNGVSLSAGELRFYRASFTGGEVNFHKLAISGGQLRFYRSELSGGALGFYGMGLSAGEIHFYANTLTGGAIYFNRAAVTGGRMDFYRNGFDGCEAHFDKMTVDGGEVRFERVEFTRGTVRFDQAVFRGGSTTFLGSRFTGAEVRFDGARFLGGPVDFGNAGDWSVPPVFPAGAQRGLHLP